MIGRFGFGPRFKPDRFYAYVSPQYVPDKSFRLPDWEQVFRVFVHKVFF